MEEYEKQNAKGRIWRLLAVITVAMVFVVLIIASLTSRALPGDQAWDERSTVGNLEAKNYYIMYTDLMCPYCDVFSREALNHWDEFTEYLSSNDILFEVRLTDYLYEGSGIQASRDSAEATYCAMREDRFWDYYHAAIGALWDDYHSKGIGVSKTATPIKDMPEDYWLKIGQKLNLGEPFEKCVKNHEAVAEIEENTRKALSSTNGMPFFQFNRFTTSGFDSNWDWTYVKRYLDAGLEK